MYSLKNSRIIKVENYGIFSFLRSFIRMNEYKGKSCIPEFFKCFDIQKTKTHNFIENGPNIQCIISF